MKRLVVSFMAFLLVLCLSGFAKAVPFDANVTPDVIFGSGNANGSFTVDQDNGVELGLRAKLRHNASGSPENTFNSNGDGSYTFLYGAAPTQSSSTAVWSFEWSINTDYNGSSGLDLDDLTYTLGIDTDPDATATSFLTFDPINGFNPGTGAVQWDHAIGDNATGNGGGASIPNSVSEAATYAALIADNNVAQNSWKPHWFITGFDPNQVGTYDFYLEAFNTSGSVARTDIRVNVAPEPTTMILFGFGLLGLAGVGRKKYN